MGCTVLLSRFNSMEDEQFQVGIPIDINYRDERYETLVIPSEWMLSVIHYGDYYTIGHAYGALMQSAQENNILIGK